MNDFPLIPPRRSVPGRISSRIIAANVAVFFLWLILGMDDHGFMAQNFLVSWTGLREGRVWTLFTSVFSHATFLHLFLNMIVLRSFGAVMEQALGQKQFIRFFLAAGAIASLSHCLVSAFILGDPALPALGASGAISGLVLLFALLFPGQRILFFGIIPLPALWAAVILVGIDTWGLIEQVRGGGLPICYGAHIGGALTGLLYYVLFLRRPVPVGEGWSE
ncbi:MAG: rhomboid family intramembrane serine protease [Bdellovibrionota bacterium]